MKILLYENDPRESALIRQVLDGKRTTVVPVASSEEAWEYFQSNEAHFLIANWETSDLQTTRFLQRVRASTLAQSVFILLTTSKNLEDVSAPQGMDDIIQRPIKAADLKNRVAMAERIISLAGSLADRKSVV